MQFVPKPSTIVSYFDVSVCSATMLHSKEKFTRAATQAYGTAIVGLLGCRMLAILLTQFHTLHISTLSTPPPLTHIPPHPTYPKQNQFVIKTTIAATMFPHLSQRLFAGRSASVVKKGLAVMGFTFFVVQLSSMITGW